MQTDTGTKPNKISSSFLANFHCVITTNYGKLL